MLCNARSPARALSPRFRSELGWQYPGQHGPGRFADLRRCILLLKEIAERGRLAREPNGSLPKELVGGIFCGQPLTRENHDSI